MAGLLTTSKGKQGGEAGLAGSSVVLSSKLKNLGFDPRVLGNLQGILMRVMWSEWLHVENGLEG